MSSFIVNSSNLALDVPELALEGHWGTLHSYSTHPQPLEIEEKDFRLEENIEEHGNIFMQTLSEFYQL